MCFNVVVFCFFYGILILYAKGTLMKPHFRILTGTRSFTIPGTGNEWELAPRALVAASEQRVHNTASLLTVRTPNA